MGSGGRGGPPTVFCVVLLVLVSTQVKKITIPFTLKNGLSCTGLPPPTLSTPSSQLFICYVSQESHGKETRQFGFNVAAGPEAGWTTFDPIPYKKQERLVSKSVKIN